MDWTGFFYKTAMKHSRLTFYRSKKCIAAKKFLINRQNATAQL